MTEVCSKPRGLSHPTPGELTPLVLMHSRCNTHVRCEDREECWGHNFFSLWWQNILLYSVDFALAWFSTGLFPHRFTSESIFSILYDAVVILFHANFIYSAFISLILLTGLLEEMLSTSSTTELVFFSKFFISAWTQSSCSSLTSLYREIKGFPERSMLPRCRTLQRLVPSCIEVKETVLSNFHESRFWQCLYKLLSLKRKNELLCIIIN